MRKRSQITRKSILESTEALISSDVAGDSVSDAEWRQLVGSLLPDMLTPDREALRSELIALYHEYAKDAQVAEAIVAEHEEVATAARETMKRARLGGELVEKLLRMEFPDFAP